MWQWSGEGQCVDASWGSQGGEWLTSTNTMMRRMNSSASSQPRVGWPGHGMTSH